LDNMQSGLGAKIQVWCSFEEGKGLSGRHSVRQKKTHRRLFVLQSSRALNRGGFYIRGPRKKDLETRRNETCEKMRGGGGTAWKPFGVKPAFFLSRKGPGRRGKGHLWKGHPKSPNKKVTSGEKEKRGFLKHTTARQARMEGSCEEQGVKNHEVWRSENTKKTAKTDKNEPCRPCFCKKALQEGGGKGGKGRGRGPGATSSNKVDHL